MALLLGGCALPNIGSSIVVTGSLSTLVDTAVRRQLRAMSAKWEHLMGQDREDGNEKSSGQTQKKMNFDITRAAPSTGNNVMSHSMYQGLYTLVNVRDGTDGHTKREPINLLTMGRCYE